MSSDAAELRGAELDALCADLFARRQVIVASNRGPVSFHRTEGDRTVARTESPATLGALTAARGRLELTWVSVASGDADRKALREADGGPMTRGLPEGWAARLIQPSRRAHHRFYNVICNPLLWFLHHRSWGLTHTPNIDHEAHSAWERGFTVVSEQIGEAVADEAGRSGRPAAVFLRGYHMHLVPHAVRKALSGALIHYAPGAPWPETGDWLALPRTWGEQVHRSVLYADVVAFAGHRDRRAFAAAVEELASGAEVDRDSWVVDGPSGVTRLVIERPAIEPGYFEAVASSHRARQEAARMETGAGVHTFVTADRAEPFRNVVRCVRAFEAMLAGDRALRGNVRYLLMLAPPPPHLAQYRRYVDEVTRSVEAVNRRFGDGGWRPVELRMESDFAAAMAALGAYDTLVAMPIADAQASTALAGPLVNRRDGSLIVSTTSVAAEIFGDAVQVVAASDVAGLAAAMADAVAMTGAERGRRAARAEEISLGLSPEKALCQLVKSVLEAGGWRARA